MGIVLMAKLMFCEVSFTPGCKTEVMREAAKSKSKGRHFYINEDAQDFAKNPFKPERKVEKSGKRF